MYSECLARFPNCDGAVMCAAVADFTPVFVDTMKTKRGKNNWSIELQPTKDIAAALGELKNENQIIAGFALETNDETDNARKKLESKNLDFIVLNSLNDKGAGFQVDTNKITIIDKSNNQQFFELKSKQEVAVDIVNKIKSILK
jgi:phosphopantothenoylcysteine decarboxylase/phosphopantothenate--cysteine ligase